MTKPKTEKSFSEGSSRTIRFDGQELAVQKLDTGYLVSTDRVDSMCPRYEKSKYVPDADMIEKILHDMAEDVIDTFMNRVRS